MKFSKEFCEDHFKGLDLATQQHIIAIVMELNRAEEKHPNWPTDDFVYAAAIVNEEAGELIKAAIQYEHEGGKFYQMHSEAIQTGAMVVRFLNNAHLKCEFCNGTGEREVNHDGADVMTVCSFCGGTGKEEEADA